MTSVSSAMAGLGLTINGQTANPETLNAWLLKNGGYVSNLFSLGAVGKLGLKYQNKSSSSADIKKAIRDNKVVVLNVNGGGHWVLATGIQGNTYTVNDSGSSKTSFPFSGVTQAAIFTF